MSFRKVLIGALVLPGMAWAYSPVQPIAQGGTGATTAVGARVALGLGSLATQAASLVTITGGTAVLSTLAVNSTLTIPIYATSPGAALLSGMIGYNSTTGRYEFGNATSTPINHVRLAGDTLLGTLNLVAPGGADNSAAAVSSAWTRTYVTGLGYATLASPNLTGTPLAPTASPLTSTTQIGTTAYADAAVLVETNARITAVNTTLPLAGGTMTGALHMGANLIDGSNMGFTGGSFSGLTSSTFGSNTGTSNTLAINSAAGKTKQLQFDVANVARWSVVSQNDAEAASVATTANGATTASATLVITTATGITNGMSVVGTGIPLGTIVLAGGGTTTLTLSVVATVANLAALTFYPNTGSTFALRAADDAGNTLYTPILASRASGAPLTLGTLNYGPIVVYGGVATFAGSARGPGAFDAQQYRTANAQVASGPYAAVFGNANTASGTASFIGGQANSGSGAGNVAFGNGNILTGTYSTAPGGAYASDRGRYGASMFAAGQAAAVGDTQTGFGVLRAASTTSAGAVLTADGGAAGAANVWNIPSNTAYLVRMDLLGWYAGGPKAVSYVARFRLRRGVGPSTTVISNTTITADADNDTITSLTAPTLAADTTNGGLTITSGWTSLGTMRWAARIISTVELQ